MTTTDIHNRHGELVATVVDDIPGNSYGVWPRRFFELIDDEPGIEGNAWRHRPGPAIDEDAYLATGYLVTITGAYVDCNDV